MSALTILLYKISAKNFGKFDRQNYWRKQSNVTDPKRNPSGINLYSKLKKVFPYLEINPLLYKNLLQIRDSSTTKMNSLLIFIFISLAYLASRNEDYVTDTFSVLRGIMLLFYAVYGYTSLNKLHSAVEPPTIIHSLPIRKMDFYFAAFLPPFATLMFINTLTTVWLFYTTQMLSASLEFWLSSGLGIIVWLTTAINCGIPQYPDIVLAKNRVIIWYLGYLILGAIFFRYVWIVLPILFASTFIQLKNINLFGPYFISKTRKLFV